MCSQVSDTIWQHPYSWDLYSWPGTGEIPRIFDDHHPIFSETYLIAEEHETEVLEEIEASEPFHEAFIQTGEEAIVSAEVDWSWRSKLCEIVLTCPIVTSFYSVHSGSNLRFVLSNHTWNGRLVGDAIWKWGIQRIRTSSRCYHCCRLLLARLDQGHPSRG